MTYIKTEIELKGRWFEPCENETFLCSQFLYQVEKELYGIRAMLDSMITWVQI